MSSYQQFRKAVNIIILLLKEILSLEEQQVNDLLEGKATVKLDIRYNNSSLLKNQVKIAKKTVVTEDSQQVKNLTTYSVDKIGKNDAIVKTEEIFEILDNLNNREEGLKVLGNLCPTKKDLQNLARHIDIPNNKKDGIDILREKIIEATIGYRLRSRAIQGQSIPIEQEKPEAETPKSNLAETVQDKTILTPAEKP